MKISFYLHILLAVFILPLSACGEGSKLKTNVRVFDEHGVPIEGAHVHIGYPSPQPSNVRGESGKGHTGENGYYSFSGTASWKVSIKVSKEGYYDSLGVPDITVADASGIARLKPEIDATLTLRGIRNPVPMAAGRTQMDFPSAKGSYGFDLIERDWLPPHGVGEKADILVHVDFVFNEWLDHDMQIKWEFVGEPNGIQPFEPIEESTFSSPYLAPINGYEKEVSWRNRRFERDQWSSSMDRYSVENVNDLSASGDGRGQGRFFYLFRIRSEVDENGEIVGGHYGKIYGFGAMLRPDQDFPGGHHTGVIYLNPQEGDRNLEMDLEENLLTGLPRFWGPRRP